MIHRPRKLSLSRLESRVLAEVEDMGDMELDVLVNVAAAPDRRAGVRGVEDALRNLLRLGLIELGDARAGTPALSREAQERLVDLETTLEWNERGGSWTCRPDLDLPRPSVIRTAVPH